MSADAASRRPRKNQSQAREKLLAATSALLTQHSPDAITTRQIAERAGVDRVLISRYFGGKENLMREALIVPLRGFAEAVRTGGTAMEGFARSFDYICQQGFSPLFGLELVALQRGDPASSYPATAAHVGRIGADIERLGMPAAAGTAEARHVALVVAAAQMMMVSWARIEDWALAVSGFGDGDRAEARRRYFGIVERMLIRELGLPESEAVSASRRRWRDVVG